MPCWAEQQRDRSQILIPPGPALSAPPSVGHAPNKPRPQSAPPLLLSVQSRLPPTPRPRRPRPRSACAGAVFRKPGSGERGAALVFSVTTGYFRLPSRPRSATSEVQGSSRTLRPPQPLVPRSVSPGSIARH